MNKPIEGIVIEKNPNTAWAFTYKVLGSSGANDMSTYAVVVDNLSANGFIKHIRGEKDSKGKFHIHGIVMLRKNFHRKKLVMHGYNCLLKEVYDEKDWIKYCDKDQEKLPTAPPYLFDNIYLT